ncbi:MAG: methyltransferase domain-containing protein, partial [Lachnospiraceae bacterium]|nr:methyltransferase domain-containing protein [Lachnospiraceae bacterium]
GAGNGRFEVALKQHGYSHITGSDPSEDSVGRLQKKGIASYVSSIYSEAASEEMEKYDCIFLFEVAEHLLIPGKGIDNVRKMLKKNGIFMISVHDYSQIGEDVTSIPNHFNLEHINYFSAESLDYLMALHGMKRIAHKHEGIDLIQVYRKADKIAIPEKDAITETAVRSYFQKQREREEQVKSVIETLKEKGEELIIWGTGSYVMSLLAATNLSECNIKGFVDNNKIKQGRKMYGYTIYPPAYLEDKNCTILVCSMLNGQQIKEQIEKMNTKNTIVLL